VLAREPPRTAIRPSADAHADRARLCTSAKRRRPLSAARLRRAFATLTNESPTRTPTVRARRVSKVA
jgi:hypothetical protein